MWRSRSLLAHFRSRSRSTPCYPSTCRHRPQRAVVNLVVISTAYAPLTRHLCEASVRAQLGGPYEHLYIDAEQQDPERTCSQNLWMMIGGLNPSDVVVWVDGDDWLAHNLVLGDVAAMHKRGALLTYGSYITKDGEPGISAPYIGTEYRREPW